MSIFDYINGSEIWRGHTDNAIEGGRFSPNGNFLVIHGSGVIQIWEVHGKHVFQRQSISVDNSVKDVAFFSNNEKILAILKNDGTLQFWDIENRTEALSPLIIENSPIGIEFHPTEDIAAITYRLGIEIWDVHGGRLLFRSKPSEFACGGSHSGIYSKAVFNLDGTTLAFGGKDEFGIIDVSSLTTTVAPDDIGLKQVEGKSAESPILIEAIDAPYHSIQIILPQVFFGNLIRPFDKVIRPQFSPCGKFLSAISYEPEDLYGDPGPDAKVHIWNTQSGEEVFSRLHDLALGFPSVTFGHDGIALLSFKNIVEAWDINATQKLWTIDWDESVQHAEFLPLSHNDKLLIVDKSNISLLTIAPSGSHAVNWKTKIKGVFRGVHYSRNGNLMAIVTYVGQRAYGDWCNVSILRINDGSAMAVESDFGCDYPVRIFFDHLEKYLYIGQASVVTKAKIEDGELKYLPQLTNISPYEATFRKSLSCGLVLSLDGSFDLGLLFIASRDGIVRVADVNKWCIKFEFPLSNKPGRIENQIDGGTFEFGYELVRFVENDTLMIAQRRYRSALYVWRIPVNELTSIGDRISNSIYPDTILGGKRNDTSKEKKFESEVFSWQPSFYKGHDCVYAKEGLPKSELQEFDLRKMSEVDARLHFWQKYQLQIRSELQRWIDAGWEPITEVGPASIILKRRSELEKSNVMRALSFLFLEQWCLIGAEILLRKPISSC